MSLQTPISVAEQTRQVAKVLDDWARPKGGYAKVLANMRHLWEELLQLHDTPAIFVVLQGEAAKASQALDRDYRTHRIFNVAVIRGHGFKSGMNEPVGDTIDSFYDNVETVRDLVRCILTISEEFPVDYMGMDPLPSIMRGDAANVFGDGYLIKFRTANNVPVVYRTTEQLAEQAWPGPTQPLT